MTLKQGFNLNQILSLAALAAIVVAILFGLAWCGQIKETEKVLAEKDAITEQALVARNAAKAEYDQSQAEAAGWRAVNRPSLNSSEPRAHIVPSSSR